MDSNVGGYFGPYLKFSGFDAMEIQGKTGSDGHLDRRHSPEGPDPGGERAPREAHEISEIMTHHFGQGKARNISVVTTGPAPGIPSWGASTSPGTTQEVEEPIEQAGRGGLGTVFADKGLMAIVARWDTVTVALNNPADEEALEKGG